MKTSKLVVLFGLVVVLGVSTLAGAGKKDYSGVRVYPGGASGSPGAARASADNNQLIYCELEAYVSGPYTDFWGECEAVDATGKWAYCYFTTDFDKFSKVIASISDSSYIEFYTNNNTLYCNMIRVRNSSIYMPRPN